MDLLLSSSQSSFWTLWKLLFTPRPSIRSNMSASAPTITISPSAYTLLVHHSAAHAASTVTGFLLGSISSDGSQVTVERVIPLAHHWTPLAAMEDAALALVESHLAGDAGSGKSTTTTLLGLYEVPSRLDRTTLSPSALRLGSKIASRLTSSKGKSTSSASGGIGGKSLALLGQAQGFLNPRSSCPLLPFLLTAKPTSTPQSLSSSKNLSTAELDDGVIEGLKKSLRTFSVTATTTTGQGWKSVRDFDGERSFGSRYRVLARYYSNERVTTDLASSTSFETLPTLSSISLSPLPYHHPENGQ